jgi:hypothetical protein
MGELKMKDFLMSNGVLFENAFLKIPESCERVKIDVGLSASANQSEVWLSEDLKLFVFGFEPVSHNLKVLRDKEVRIPGKLSHEHLTSRVTLIPCALSSVNVPDGVDIFVTADFGTSS